MQYINKQAYNHWAGRTVAITGARGELGRALTQSFRSVGARVVGLTHCPPPLLSELRTDLDGPNEWQHWCCGKEEELDELLISLDVLVLNHGINPHGHDILANVDNALEINALSTWRLIRRFNELVEIDADSIGQFSRVPRELWVNTSEAEIQPALSLAYEISKRLLGQLVSLQWAADTQKGGKNLIIRKLVLGPFRSNLNPIGLMSAGFVAARVLQLASLGIRLIIVTPNPITYIVMPLTELGRWLYARLLLQFSRHDL